jgi:ABC-2 type transport system permease protein
VSALHAIVRRELARYFGSPTGYVFITLFVFLSATAAFWQPEFFAANLANLDPLNRYFPYLLVFLVPAIAMGLWADERRHGTDELLLTLPVRDLTLVLGKYLAALAIYTVALLFSLSHVVVLSLLGNPDPGLMVATYLGYWLMGATLLSVAMTGSLLTDNLTVAFILGAALTALPVSAHHAELLVTGSLQRLLVRLSIAEQFRGLSLGVVTPAALVYFVAFAAVFQAINVHLLARRHWPTGRGRARPRVHLSLRALALLVAAASLTLIASHARTRIDATSERLHSLAPETLAQVRSLDRERPVFIEAYLSPDVPDAYLETRAGIVTLLRELPAVSEGRIETRVIETVKYSPEAREARDRYGIRPTPVLASEESVGAPREILMGLVFNSGTQEHVIPFFDRGLPVEYELLRSIRAVAGAKRRKVGFLKTGVDVFGGFDFARKRQESEWSIVAELRKQYEVVSVAPGGDYPPGIDALVAPLPHTLDRAGLGRLVEYAKEDRPLLLLLDPLPAFNLDLAPSDPAPGPFGPAPTRPERADLRPLLRVLGVRWPVERIVWSKDNPHPQLRHLPPEVVFVTERAHGESAFNPQAAVSAGLQELVLLYPGQLAADPQGGTTFTPLVTLSEDSGSVPFSRLVIPSFFGATMASDLRHEPDKERHVLAARISGKGPDAVNAIIVADADLMGEQFFEIRRRGTEKLNFDNVTFLLNAVDQLAGDEAMIALRKRRPRHRRLEAVEGRTRAFETRAAEQTRQAEAIAQTRLAEAQQRMDKAVGELRGRTDVDEQTREIMLQNLRATEERRLKVARATIEDERERHIEASRAEMETAVRAIQSTIKLAAVALPPVPAFALFLVMSLRRLRRERIGGRAERLVKRDD